MDFPTRFDVIVIGGGHAGTEAALASARMGLQTFLLTHNIETLGMMSCNPSIGGIGKSHLVKEIDALGGAMAQAIDLAGIQFRILNAKKGPAVRATRAQADRTLYRSAISNILKNQKNLWIFQQSADNLIISQDKVAGVVTNTGVNFFSDNVVLTVGTFLDGRIHIGLENYSGGRSGDPPSIALSTRLRELNFPVKRLKTGTPARIDARSVDFSVMEEQPGDRPIPVMSYIGSVDQHPKQVSCFITHTNERTHEIIRGGLKRSPLFMGMIQGVSPRYCPSIEDKIIRFSNKNAHQIFLEPEGLTTNELYPNGISTSLPFDLQIKLIRSIRGLENAHITRPGYAIEYDYFDPRGLKYSLETKAIGGLFFAGQLNGTTGYEEAAAQGLLAGLNAGLRAQDKAGWCPRRDEAYIGVLVDDLITQGTNEPYRMFTSRAEYRLMLREDNADLRLTEKGRDFGLIDNTRWSVYCNKKELIEKENKRLYSTYIHPKTDASDEIDKKLSKPINREYSLQELLRRPELNYNDVANLSGNPEKNIQVREQVEIAIKYAGYINRQTEDIDRFRRHEKMKIPIFFNYEIIEGLSSELKQKLSKNRPETLGRASRMQGMTPAAISLLLIYLKKNLKKHLFNFSKNTPNHPEIK